jgi:putative restriction endonuclease
MNIDELIKQFASLGTWVRGHQEAPHKPLLVLYALGRWQRGITDDIPYPEVDVALGALLRRFGPSRKSVHPEYPFWRLQRDGVWIVRSDGPMRSRASNTDPLKSELIAKHARGGFADDVKRALEQEPSLAVAIASQLLERHFPRTRHVDILQAVGFSLE